MKSKALPNSVVWGILALLVVIVGIFAYMSFFKPVPQVDPNTLSPQRLEDPDMRGQS